MSVLDFRDVSPHIFDLLTNHQIDGAIYAIEDVITIDGNVLVKSGDSITQKQKDVMVNKRLAKPLETSISLRNVISAEDFYKEGRALLSEHPILKKLFEGVENEIIGMSKVLLEPLPSLLLTLSAQKDKKMLKHTVLMTLIARLIAKRLQIDDAELVLLTQAAQAHDIGELYLDPSSTLKNGRLTPEQWKVTMAHPKVGAMLIKHHTNYAPEVARAVYEHHERSDGSGYPRQLVDSQISEMGKILMVAELLAGMLLKPTFPIRRALLVMNFLPNEFPRKVMNAVHSYMTENTLFDCEMNDENVDWANIKDVVSKFHLIVEAVTSLLNKTNSILESEVLEEAGQKLQKVKRAISSLGLDFCLNPFAWESIKDDPIVRLEIDVAIREIAWRLRDIARDMVLNLGESAHESSADLKALIEKMAQVSLTKT